jgi:hypothetical protein
MDCVCIISGTELAYVGSKGSGAQSGSAIERILLNNRAHINCPKYCLFMSYWIGA